MKKVAVVGIGTLPWQARNEDKTFRSLALEAVKKALEDAKLSRADIDLVIYSIFSEVMLRQQIPTVLLQDYLGFQGLPSLRIEAGAAGEGYAFNAAYGQIASGRSDLTLLIALQKGADFYDFKTASREAGYGAGTSNATDATWLQPVMPCSEALLNTFSLMPHMEKYGSPTVEQLAAVVIKNHANASRNPEAQSRGAVTMDDVLSAPVIAAPITSLMCALHSDGACALILASEDKAREITDKPIWLTGTGTSSYAAHRAGPENIGRLMGTHIAARKAYKMAGVTKPAEEFDLAQVHDLVSGLEIMAYEELGLCELGQGGRLLDKGVVAPGGKVPVNIDGGRIACGHAGGVSGAYAACEIVKQLREEAGERQVPIRTGRGVMQCIDSHGSMNSVSVFAR